MYEPKEREIFVFAKWVGGENKQVFADPQAVHRKLLLALGGDDLEKLFEHMQAEPEKDATPEQVRACDARSFKAAERILSIAQAAFDLKPLDEAGNGATEREQMDTLTAFLQFLADAKKKGESSPTCSEPTAPASSAAA